MTTALHPFDQVPMRRIEQSNPRFLRNLNLSALRRNIEAQRAAVNLHRASQHLGPQSKIKGN